MLKKRLEDRTVEVFKEYFKVGEPTDFKTLEMEWKKIDTVLMQTLVRNYFSGEHFNEYYQSRYWRTISKEVKRRADNRCQLCNDDSLLAVHHRCYTHLGMEVFHMNDLTCLCNECHAKHHGKDDAKSDKLPKKAEAIEMAIKVLKEQLSFIKIDQLLYSQTPF